MLLDLKVPAERLMPIARALKRSLDSLQLSDSGWGYVQFDHIAFGRDSAPTTAERVPGDVIVSTDEPPNTADAIVVAVGFQDPYTGDVSLGNMLTFVRPVGLEEERPDEDSEEGDEERVPAVALFKESGTSKALTGTLHLTRERRFETAGTWPELDEALREWLEALAADPDGQQI